MISKNWPTELKKMSESQTAVVFRKRSRSKSAMENMNDRLSLSIRSLSDAVSSSSDNLSIIGLSSKNAHSPSSSPASSSKDNDKSGSSSQKSSSKDTSSEVPPTLTSKEAKDAEKKEKKRKALSSSRQKKFFRHFPQVSTEENVINYFSCALVSDILLQGHMYITANYFAFYSNVFGFVTKLLIPVASVERISKEKTAKIIPNAIGVATVDERHVFGSFMSRESAYRLMLSVWRPEEETCPALAAVKAPVDVEISECSIEEDSSCSVSGNESPTILLKEGLVTVSPLDQQSLLLRQRIQPVGVMETSGSSTGGGVLGLLAQDGVDGQSRLKLLPEAMKVKDSPQHQRLNGGSGGPVAVSDEKSNKGVTLVLAKESPMTWLKKRVQKVNLKFPTDIHIVYLGVILAIILALFSGFLLYRIMDIQARTNHMEYNWRPKRDLDAYDDVLKWQREIQERSVEETQNILNINLEQILKVRKSLESLSSLINGKRDSPAKGIDSAMKT